jgi:hypothetical protein
VIWDDAVTACQAKGASIASIADATEQADVVAMLSADAWIGLNDGTTDDTFLWEDGSSPAYTNWYGTSNPLSPPNGKPNCVKMQFANSGEWNDVGCSKTLNYVCRMDAADSCNPTTTVATTTTSTTSTTTTTTATTTTTFVTTTAAAGSGSAGTR